MKTLKYSRQREAIREVLKGRYDHPTAECLYTTIKKSYPNISLGTVYRNLNLLVELGEAIRITSKNGSDRYDATTNTHYHFVCNECGVVSDIDMPSIENLEQKASSFAGGVVDSHEITFFGICNNCKNCGKIS